MFASVVTGLQEFVETIAPSVLSETVRDVRNWLVNGVKVSKSITRLSATWATATVMLTLSLTGVISLKSLETNAEKAAAIATLTLLPMWAVSKIAKLVHQQVVKYQSRHLDKNIFIPPKDDLQFTNSRLFVRRDDLTDVVHQFWQIFQDKCRTYGATDEASLQQLFSDYIVPITLAEIINKTELHDLAKAALNGARTGNPTPLFEFIEKYLGREDTEKRILQTLVQHADALNDINPRRAPRPARTGTNLEKVTLSNRIGEAARNHQSVDNTQISEWVQNQCRSRQAPEPNQMPPTSPLETQVEEHECQPVTPQYTLIVRGRHLKLGASEKLVTIQSDEDLQITRRRRIAVQPPSSRPHSPSEMV